MSKAKREFVRKLKGYKLADIQPGPAQGEVKSGSFVKIVLLYDDDDLLGSEGIWVKVKSETAPDEFRGIVDNDTFGLHLDSGSTVYFKRRHIREIYQD